MAHQEAGKICPLCRQPALFVFLKDYDNGNNKFSLWQCNLCGGQFWLPYKNPGTEWYSYGDSYNVKDINRPRRIHSYHKHFLNLHQGRLKNDRLLDLGCGTGEFLAELKKYGAEVYGTDIDKESIKIARDFHGLNEVFSLSIEDFFKAPPVSWLDYVTVFEVFEHVDDVAIILESSKKILKPGGKLIMSTPSRERPFVNAVLWDYPYHHLSRWDEKAIRYILGRFNYAEVKVVYINKFHQLYELFLEVVAKKLKFNKAAKMKQIVRAGETAGSGERATLKKMIIRLIYKTGRFVGVVLLPYALALLFYPVSLIFYPRAGIMYIEATAD